MDKIYGRIIFATDLGPQSLYIGQHAAKISRLCQAQLIAMHVIEPPLTYTVEFNKRDAQLKDQLKRASLSLAALCEQLKIKDIEQVVKVGSPQNEILTQSLHLQCDLIVVGSHGVGGYTHALGSTAHHLLSEAHCDVLTVQVTHLEQAIQPNPSAELYLWQALDTKKIQKTPQARGPKYTSSEHGFGGYVQRGPRLTMRPPGTPIRGGTRRKDKSEDPDKE
ncbi:MAG: universal stress protein [Proteobacteria bacterium]|nr:universal stress protein [Pseudomonadota bacterium]